MAHAGELAQTIVVPARRGGEPAANRDPVLNWVLIAVVAAIVSSLGMCVWILQEVLAIHPAAPGSRPLEFLLSSGRGALVGVLGLPMIVAVVFWSLLTLMVLKRLHRWRDGLLSRADRTIRDLRRRMDEADGRVSRASASADFWKAQTRELSQKVSEAEGARAALEERMTELASREKALAKAQGEMSRSKERLEKHVEVRTIELKRLQQRYASILTSAGEGICSCDLEGRISFANPAAAAMMGWESEALLGLNETEVFADHSVAEADAGDVPRVEEAHKAPVVFRRRDGSTFPVEMVRTPVEEGGRRVGTVLIFKDVTERTEADERFAAKVAELARSNSELEQFAFVASHDLQEPLRKIQAFGDRLKSRVGDSLSTEATDYLQRMQSAAARMAGLIDGLLMYSRVLTRAQPCTAVDLGVVVREVIEDLEVRVEKAEADVVIGELPVIEADALQIRQLLQNLIGNALKFKRPDSKPRVSITARLVSADRQELTGWEEVDRLPHREFCELCVQDDGIGFDEAYLKRLFVVFQRLHSRSEYEGAGIGLAVCRKIANRHGGMITARSKPGEGATFLVLLPLEQESSTGGAA